MFRIFQTACMAIVMLTVAPLVSGQSANATSRIKDLANIEGVRQNQLIGYGLVVGLNGTGDTLNNIPFTKQSLQAMLERMGVNIRGATDLPPLKWSSLKYIFRMEDEIDGKEEAYG